MVFVKKTLPVTTLAYTLLQVGFPAYAQTTITATQVVTSTLAASASPTVFPLYSFYYPVDSSDGPDYGIQVSSKDTIDVSWAYDGSQHPPVLGIECWTRNTSNSFTCLVSPLHPT